jgi:hypothetical protein
MKKNNFLLILLVFVSFQFAVSSCIKKKDTIAKVFVKYPDNLPATSCTVILKPVPSDGSATGNTLIPADTSITNSKGEAIFNCNHLYQLGQAGVAVLNIVVDKEGFTGNGVIQLKEQETSIATVFLK